MFLRNFIKNKTVLLNLKRLKYILDCNPGLIITVREDERELVLNENGEWVYHKIDSKLWPKFLELIKAEIKTRPDPLHRIESWECLNVYGHFSEKLYYKLFNSRKNIRPRVKKFIDQRALRQLTEDCSVSEYMGELFLSELKLYTGNNPEALKQVSKARILRLIK